jgi:hypothetical protein
MSKLSLKEMQELLPDFAFNRLSDEKSQQFKANLEFYPEIKSELKELNLFLGNMDQLDINGMMKEKSRNLSVKVQQKLRRKKRSFPNSNFAYRVIMPSLAVLLMAYLTFVVDIFEVNKNKVSNVDEQFSSNEIFTDSEFDLIFSNNEAEFLSIDPIGLNDYDLANFKTVNTDLSLQFLNDLELSQNEIEDLSDFVDNDIM